MKYIYKILFLSIFLFTAIFSANSQTINLIRFNNSANYTAGSGVSVIINPTGIFQLNNQFILELSNVGGAFTTPITLNTLNEFYAPVINGTLPTGLAAGTYKLRVRATTGLGTTPETYATEETAIFTVSVGSAIGIPSVKTSLDNDSTFFNCISSCGSSQTFFGSLTQSVGAISRDMSTLYDIELCNYLKTDNYKITLIDVLTNAQTSISYDNNSGIITIPDNLAIGTYVFEIEKNTKSVYSVVLLFHGNGTSLGNSTSEVVCVGTGVSFTVDITSQGIGRNYNGSKYRVDFGDSSPVLELTQAELMANPTITHTYTTVSCAKSDSNFIIKETLLNKGVYNGGANPNYCSTYFKNGNGVEKKVNVSLAPKANFTLVTKQCFNQDINAVNTTVLGSYGTAGNCLDAATFTWYYKKPSMAAPSKVTDLSWIDNSNPKLPSLRIPASFITENGCWEIKLTSVNKDLCKTISEVTKTVKIEVASTATFTNTPETPICPNTQIQFTNTSNVLTQPCQDPTFLWTVSPSTGYQFVNPSSATSQDPKIVFTNPGTYTVKLFVTNSCGTVESISKIIEVSGSPTVSFTPNTLSICQAPPNYTIDFSQVGTKPNYSVAPFAPTSFLWSISGSGVTAGDYSYTGGTTANSQFPKINFTAFKKYDITVVVNGNCASLGQATFTFAFNESPNLNVANPSAVCTPVTVDITAPTITLGSDSGLTYSYWTDASATTPMSTPAAVTVSGIYYIKAANSNGCIIIKPVTVVVNALPVIGGTLSTCIGVSSQLSSTTTPASGNPWISSDPSVATISSTGLISPIALGTTVITYTNSNGCSKTETFTVNALPSILGNTSACINTTSQLTGNGIPASSLPWTSSNITIATVSNTGLVTAKAVGTVTITYKNSSNCSVTSTFNVNALPTITGNISVCTNSTSQLIGSGTSASSSPWVSSNPTIASVNSTGLVNALTAGTATISYTNSDGCTVNITFTVNNLPTISGPSKGCLGTMTQLSGSGTANTSSPWASSTPAIATVNNAGQVSSIAVGTTTITYKNSNGCTVDFFFSVNESPTLIVTNPLSICSPATVDITAAAITSGSDGGLNYNYWTNASATISMSTATAITTSGTYYIKATNSNGCSIIKPITVTINPQPTIGGNLKTCIGFTSQLNGSGTASLTLPWLSSNPAIATINATGLVTGLTSGTTTITYTNSNSCQKTETFTVSINPSITTTQAQTICSNSTFSIVPLDDSGNTVPVGTTYSWSAPVVTGGITGGVALANQTTIKGTLINPTNDVQTATYNVTPKSGTCTGPSFTAVVTVNPSPKVQISGPNQTLCSGSDSSSINLSSLTTGNVSFNWTATIPAGITGATASGIATIPTQTLVNVTTTPLTVIYTATATLENNGVSCSGPTLEYKITVNPAIITSSILSNFNGFNVSTVGANDGAINVTVTGGSGSYTYLWTGPGSYSASSQDISNVPAGAYSLTINDGLCNPVVLNFNLTSPLPLLIQEDTAAQIDVLCFSYLTGAIKVDITQQSIGPYDYLLTLQGGGTISSITNATATNYTFTSLAAGIYDIKVTDANGSTKSILGIEITQPGGITASISYPSNISCAGSAAGTATVTATGGIGTLTYSWNTNPIQTTATATGLTAGNYTVTITDANNCSIQKLAIITEPNEITASISSQTNVLCFGNNTGSATVSATGGTGILTYSWDTIPMQTNATATGLIAGTYNVTVTDANGCSKVKSVLITQPLTELASTISHSTNVSCFGASNGNATVSATGGTAPYTFSWNTIPVQTSVTATGLTAGTYNVTVTDAHGCVDSSPVTITEPAGMSATISAQTDVFCSGNSTGSATVTATGGTAPYSYSWNTTPVQTSAIAVNLAIGTYTATITDAKGCTTSTQATITEPNGIVISIASQTNVNCYGNNTGAVSVLVSGGTGMLTYSWDTIPVQTSLNATGLNAGTYHLTVTDANNCSKVQTVNITQPDDIIITTDLKKDITCFNDGNGEIKITVTGGILDYYYTWTKDGIPYATTDDLSDLSPGIYVLTVTDTNNCNPKTATFTITEPPMLAVSLTSQTNIFCFGEATGAIDIAVVGGTPALSGYNFAWTGLNGFTSSNKNLTAITAGTYNVVVTDNSGCSKALSVTLTQPTAIVLAAKTTPIICYDSNDASITLAISGGVTPYNIAWSNLGGGTFQDNLSAGDYLITVTDSNNCVKTLNVNIPEAPIFTINPVVKNISCFGSHDGSINLNIIGGIAPVKLVWDDNAVAGNVRNNLGPGSYTVTIVDSKPCTIKRTFIILEPQPLILTANTTNAFDCDNANSGAINLLVAGGTPPFTYSWSNGSTTEDLSNIPAGNYLVTVTDSRGCSKQAQYSINRPPPIVIGVATKTEFNCETKYVKQNFVAKVSGGVPPYQLSWSNGTVSGPNNEIMNTSQNGTAILYVTDAIGCTANYSFNVKLQSLGSPSFNATSYSYVSYGNYSIMDPIQFTNTATGDYMSIVWDFGDGSFSTDLNPVHTFINPKEYTVTQTVTYPFGCIYVQKISFIVEKGYVLFVPTAFTPNNDTFNDTFRPVTKALKNVRLDIYDTWGSMIYSETGDTLTGWDGKIKGQNAENGNYYCKVIAETFYGTIVNENHPFVLLK
ncbi:MULTISPECIES: Ig-like domain-containing protein [unclassified Flavobacterium]|uniref:Ig-like domain-containing protein n=1 Tax=unclassified Flavobacterium TaxID=196869 RepID=UPI003F90C1EB